MNYLSENLVKEAHKHVTVISLEKANQMREDGIQIIDVREEAEYSKGAIPDAANIPRSVMEFLLGKHLGEEYRDRPYVVYCRSGGRAALAAVTMKLMGYTQVHAMEKGFMEWKEEGYAVDMHPE
ncbi:MAG: rhodanese-like domain-containing protein [Cocleimonas sp.]|nr:rhodanese-like domain-containing protein [Cocleimonas sp.]